MTIKIDPTLEAKGFEIHLGALNYPVLKKAKQSETLSHSMSVATKDRREELMGTAASSDPVIASVRTAFKKAGKDPSRYRPSSEALLRRILCGHDLPEVNAPVDIGNIVSLMTGIPIGVYDMAKINGEITFTVGHEQTSYDSVTRGTINLDDILLLADDTGPFGSPFSDSKRTAVTDHTTDILFVLYGLNIDVELVEAGANMADQLIHMFCLDETRLAGSKVSEETPHD